MTIIVIPEPAIMPNGKSEKTNIREQQPDPIQSHSLASSKRSEQSCFSHKAKRPSKDRRRHATVDGIIQYRQPTARMDEDDLNALGAAELADDISDESLRLLLNSTLLNCSVRPYSTTRMMNSSAI